MDTHCAVLRIELILVGFVGQGAAVFGLLFTSLVSVASAASEVKSSCLYYIWQHGKAKFPLPAYSSVPADSKNEFFVACLQEIMKVGTEQTFPSDSLLRVDG